MKNTRNTPINLPTKVFINITSIFEEFIDETKLITKDISLKEKISLYSSEILKTNGPVGLFATLRLAGKEISNSTISYKTIKSWQKMIYDVNVELGLLLKIKNQLDINDTCNCIYHNENNQLELPLTCNESNSNQSNFVA